MPQKSINFLNSKKLLYTKHYTIELHTLLYLYMLRDLILEQYVT